MDKLRVGVCGLGCRGFVLSNILLSMPEVDVRVGCDLYDLRRDRFAAAVKEKYGKEPFVTDRYEDMVTRCDIDAVLICASWEAHVDLAVRAMEEGKITALEVGGAYSLDDCWRLVRTYEKTKTPFFFMENCCYNKDELLATSLVARVCLAISCIATAVTGMTCAKKWHTAKSTSIIAFATILCAIVKTIRRTNSVPLPKSSA